MWGVGSEDGAWDRRNLSLPLAGDGCYEKDEKSSGRAMETSSNSPSSSEIKEARNKD